jgi:hypothetical protein
LFGIADEEASHLQFWLVSDQPDQAIPELPQDDFWPKIDAALSSVATGEPTDEITNQINAQILSLLFLCGWFMERPLKAGGQRLEPIRSLDNLIEAHRYVARYAKLFEGRRLGTICEEAAPRLAISIGGLFFNIAVPIEAAALKKAADFTNTNCPEMINHYRGTYSKPSGAFFPTLGAIGCLPVGALLVISGIATFTSGGWFMILAGLLALGFAALFYYAAKSAWKEKRHEGGICGQCGWNLEILCAVGPVCPRCGKPHLINAN